MPAAQPGEVKPLRRLGRNKSGDASGGERRKRGWGATKTSRQSSTENIEVSSNSLKVMQQEWMYNIRFNIMTGKHDVNIDCRLLISSFIK